MAEPKWDDLRVFLAVARAESLSGAGRALKMDAATVGRRIARLETALTANLFQKSPQGYALTPRGERLMDRAALMETAMLGLSDDAEEAQAGALTGQIRVGAPDGAANYLLPQVCAAICAEHPGLEVQLVALPRLFNLSKREADMALTVSQPETGRLTVQKLGDYHLHLAASEAYLTKHGTPDSLAALSDHRIIGYIPDLIFDKKLDYLSAIGGPNVDLASNSVSVQVNWARGGAGLVIAHDFALPAAPELRKVLTETVALKRSFYLVRHADDRRIARLTRFAEELASRIPLEIKRLESYT